MKHVFLVLTANPFAFASGLVSVVDAPPLSAGTVPPSQPSAQPSSSARSHPAVGAFAVDLPAPVYAMEDEEDDGEWERFPAEEFQRQPRPSSAPLTPPPSAPAPEDVLEAQVAVVEQPGKEQEVEEDEGFCGGNRLYMAIGVVCLVVVAVVVVAVVVAGGGGGGGGDDDITDTLSPTQSPTGPPKPSIWDECFSSNAKLRNAMLGRRDWSTFVDVEMCPRTTYHVVDINRLAPTSGFDVVMSTQSNMRIKCGPDGDMKDQCVWTGKNGGLVLFQHYFDLFGDVRGPTQALNFTVEGMTFEKGLDSLAELTFPGEITFKNCVFRVGTCSLRRGTGQTIHKNSYFVLFVAELGSTQPGHRELRALGGRP